MDLKRLYYVKRGEQITGPYPLGLIQRYILIGRITATDEISIDRKEWKTLDFLTELMPTVLTEDPGDEAVKERLQRARRWADERSGIDRRQTQTAEETDFWERRRSGERRAPEDEDVVRARLQRQQMVQEARRAGRENMFTARVVAWSLLLVVCAYLLFYRPVPESAGANCNASARPQINWNNCQLEGVSLPGVDLRKASLKNTNFSGASLSGGRLGDADLSYAVLSITDLSSADLSGAKLLGASFRNADLRGARLDNADLSYADLTGAVLTGASLIGAKLDHAIWVDHHPCLAGSIGGCLQKRTTK